jgi:hypothetical protein
LIGVIDRAEIARAEERNDIAACQFWRFKRAEARKAEIALPFQLFGIDVRFIAEQLRTEVDLTRLRGRRSSENMRTRRRKPIPIWKNCTSS